MGPLSTGRFKGATYAEAVRLVTAAREEKLGSLYDELPLLFAASRHILHLERADERYVDIEGLGLGFGALHFERKGNEVELFVVFNLSHLAGKLGFDV